MKNYQAGDHLVSARTGYQHHGIYIGHGRVIHYAGLANGFSSGDICEVSLAEFENGNGSYRQSHHRAVYSPAEIVARAKSRLGEDQYNIFVNNCEHFANWCVTGEQYSEQVDHASRLISPTANVMKEVISEYGVKTILPTVALLGSAYLIKRRFFD